MIEELRAGGVACALCSDTLEVPVHLFRRNEVIERGEKIAGRNRRAVLEVDSLLRAGYFGPPGEEFSSKEAQRSLKLLLLTAFDYIAELAVSDGPLLETNEQELLRPLADRFLNVGVYPIRTLRRGRIGHGSYCMDYGLDGAPLGPLDQGDGLDPLFLEEVEIESRRRPILRLDFGVEGQGEIELLYLPRCCGSVGRYSIVDRGDTLDLVVLKQLEGSYVRKAGVHAMGGLAFWRGRFPKERWDQERVRVGAVAYFPGIKFELPFFLPDLGLDDLRGFDLPQPFWLGSDVRGEGRLPDWLSVSYDGTLDHWRGEGPRPAILEWIFPDL